MEDASENRASKKTYPQHWPAYNLAQTREKDHFLGLLHALCSNINEPTQIVGRPRIPLSDAIFSICYKVYSTVSARRFMSDLREAHSKGYLQKILHFNSLFNYLEKPELTDILKTLIVQTALPLTAIEIEFAVDSSGFTSTQYSRWIECKYGEYKQREWLKAHIACGVKTNIVTACEVLDAAPHDNLQFSILVEATAAAGFKVDEVLADRAYLDGFNLQMVDNMGGVAYIPFKTNSKPGPGVWGKMYHYFKFREEDFRAHYHKRSNVENTFSIIKQKFGTYIRNRTEIAIKNEVYCKIIVH